MTKPPSIYKDLVRSLPAMSKRVVAFEGAPLTTGPANTYKPTNAEVWSTPGSPAEEWVVVLHGLRAIGEYVSKEPVTDSMLLPLAPAWLQEHLTTTPGAAIPEVTLAERLKARSA